MTPLVQNCMKFNFRKIEHSCGNSLRKINTRTGTPMPRSV